MCQYLECSYFLLMPTSSVTSECKFYSSVFHFSYLFIYFSIWHLITVMEVTHCASLRRDKWLPVDFWSPIVTVNSSDDFKRIKRCWSWRRMRSRLRGAQQTEITPPRWVETVPQAKSKAGLCRGSSALQLRGSPCLLFLFFSQVHSWGATCDASSKPLVF